MLSLWRAHAKRWRRAARNRKRRSAHRRLRIERLEDRYLLATITVTDLSDDTLANLLGDGQVSLREAIEAANTDTSIDGSTAGSGADTIEFAAGLIGTIELADGEFAVTDDLTITGLSEFLLSIDAQQNSRIFNIDDSNNGNLLDVEIVGLTLTGGNVTGDGGAIRSQENLTLRDSRVTGSTATDDGGGLYVHTFNGGMTTIENSTIDNNSADNGGGLFGSTDVGGTLMVTGSTISGNTAQTDGGGFYSYNAGSTSVTGSAISSNNANDDGGGLYSLNLGNGTTTIDTTTIAMNTADADLSGSGDGGGIWAHRDLTVTSSTISGNTADGGGGVYWDSGPLFDALLIDETTVSGNTAVGENGGGISALIDTNTTATIQDSTVADNSVTGNFRSGGGISASGDGNLSIAASTISGNEATGSFGSGGGIFTYADTTVADSTISDNTTSYSGGGITSLFSDLTVTRSTISNNSVGDNGGGIFSSGTLGNHTKTIVNSTISGNTATSGGGIRTTSALMRIFNSTVTNNTANEGAGVASQGNAATTETEVRSSIIAGNNGDDVDFVVQASNTFTSLDHNVIGTGNATGAFNQTNDQVIGAADPGLAPLGFNGGPTDTHALLATSVAVDAGSNPDMLATDQRGVVREFGSGPDVGAFELGFVVDTANDEFGAGGDFSLRDALFAADNSAGVNDISFDPSLAGLPFDLTLGQLEIDDGVIIRGLGQEDQTIDAQQNSRIFDVGGGNFNVELIGLTLTGGKVSGSEDGGGIQFGTFSSDNTGTLRVISSTISGNSTDDLGGGISARSGSVTVTNSTISANSADYGGGIATSSGSVTISGSTISGNSGGESAGGIFTSSGSITITGSTISGNSAIETGGGIGSYSGSVDVTSSAISGNSAGDGGGGISTNSGSVSVTGSTISGNSAGDDGGGISIFSGSVSVTGSRISGNSAGDRGGAIDTDDGSVNITGSTISGNSAGDTLGDRGGGINTNSGSIHVTDSTISGNTAGDDGGGVNLGSGHLTAVRSTISGNTAMGFGSGGGIYSSNGTVAIIHSTISGNSATSGGGVNGYKGDVIIANSTITANTATGSGGGISMVDDYGSPSLTIESSIVAGNTASTNPDFNSPTNDNASATLAVTNSLIGDNEGTTLTESATPDGDGNIIGGPAVGGPIDPKLSPLGANGGPTQTHALFPTSPAINLGAANGQTTDQRGAPRDDGGGVDMGAFELHRFFVVTSTADSGAGTLREALLNANSLANVDPNAPDMIFFDDGTMSSTFTIQPGSALPTITDPVVIDGTSEPDFVGAPVIVLDGDLAGVGVNGLKITAGGSTVRGLVINGFDSIGIDLKDGGGNVIQGNFIGTDVTGTAAAGNALHGVGVTNSSGNTIGGTAAGAGNVISGNNRHGVVIVGGSSTGNIVQGNLIGVGADGSTPLGNGFAGVRISGAADNTIGGTTSAARNVISGNSENGVEFQSGTTGNVVSGNFIGTDVTGTTAIGNGLHGVRVTSAADNTIGGTAGGAGNLISGNVKDGVVIEKPGATGNRIEGNLIGTDVTGGAPLKNELHGVALSVAESNFLGGTAAGAGNVISGNERHGVVIFSAGANNNVVQGNLIGLDVSGTSAVGNGQIGIRLTKGSNNLIGGTATGAGNIIGANGLDGILIERSQAQNNRVEGNLIGTNLAGDAGLGNLRQGVGVSQSSLNTIGGTAEGAGNVIAGNDRHGVVLIGGAATDNLVQGNRIGVTLADGALGNGLSGVRVTNAPNNTIGGTATGAGNIIAHNQSRGVDIRGNSSTGNTISRNSMFSNTNLGIDLNGDNLSANDANDADNGPNRLQNFPEITSAVMDGGNIDVTYSVPSISPNSTFPLTVEFFLADADNQEGQTFLGADTYTEGTTPTISIAAGGAIAGDTIVATATDANGNTSEFSTSVVVTNAAPLLASGGQQSGGSRAEAGEQSAESGEPSHLRFGNSNSRLRLDESQLQPIVDAAIKRLSATGLTAEQLTALSSVTFAIADLPGATLGLAAGNKITLDTNAAGYGWYIDPTPLDDAEFLSGSGLSTLDSQLHMDLLTVVMHEMEHTLGHDHSDAIDDLLNAELPTGTRRLPTVEAIDVLFGNPDLLADVLG